MKSIRSITIAITMMVAFCACAAFVPMVGAQGAPSIKAPPVEPQLKLLTDRLELTADQQGKIKPILQELYDTTVKLVQDENMSHAEQMNGVHTARLTADRKMRVMLSEEQKKELDQVESEPHPELHGEVK